MSISAVRYDGKTSQRTLVELRSDGSRLHVSGEGINRTWLWTEVRVSSRIGDTPRRLDLPDGSQCETANNDGIDAWLVDLPDAPAFSVYRLERNLCYALAALALTALVAWLGVAYGIPALAKQVAFSLPPSTERLIGGDALRALDQTMLGPSTLPPERAAHVRDLLAGMAADLDAEPRYQLELRAGRRLGAAPGIGAQGRTGAPDRRADGFARALQGA